MKINRALEIAKSRREEHCNMYGGSYFQVSGWNIPNKESEINILNFMVNKLGGNEEYSFENIVKSLQSEDNPRKTFINLFSSKRYYDIFMDYEIKWNYDQVRPLVLFLNGI